MSLDAAWHRAHPMPKRPTVEERLAWHREHAAHCGCRPVPPRLAALLAKLQARTSRRTPVRPERPR
jgi:hypothetical protein